FAAGRSNGSEAGAKEGIAETAKKAAEMARDKIQELFHHQAQKSRQLADKNRILAKFGVTADCDELRRQIDALKADAEAHEQKASTEEEGRQLATAEANRLEGGRKAMAQRLITGLEIERRHLSESGIAEEFQKLEQDEALLRGEWARQL